MDPRRLFVDERHMGKCVYCGNQPETRDHVPSKVLLDEPLPPELPVVAACYRCNNSFSLDEQYLACFLDCVICGSAKVTTAHRSKIVRILESNPSLQSMIEEASFKDSGGNLVWRPNVQRVKNVMMKLARGHAAFELYPKFEEPIRISSVPLHVLKDGERQAFESGTSSDGTRLWPEIGSRAFLRALGYSPDGRQLSRGWNLVQPQRYRYCVVESAGVFVRIVLSEYLACEVLWEY